MTNKTDYIIVYGTENLVEFSKRYAKWHGWVSLIICSLGIIGNVFNIIVLTRKTMISTTNYLLTALAVSDLFTMLSYVPFALHFYIIFEPVPSPERDTKTWGRFLVFHYNFTVTTHTTAIWLGVVLSAFRYSYIRGSNRFSSWWIFGVYICSVIILLPMYLSVRLKEEIVGNNGSIYCITEPPPESFYTFIVTRLNFWIHAIIIKLLPCIFMLVFGVLLVWTLKRTETKSLQLR